MRRSIKLALIVPFMSLVSLALAACEHNELTQPALRPSRMIIGPTFPKANPGNFVDIVAGNDFTCARKLDMTVYCWGIDTFDQTGGLTDWKCTATGTVTNSSSASGTPCRGRPTVVMIGSDTLRATQIEAGSSHVCVLNTANEVWCWGDDTFGELGNGFTGTFSPTKVVGGVTFTGIAAGGRSTCAFATTGIFCWGAIQNNATTPQLVTSNTAWLSALTVGDEHACVLDASGGVYDAVDCWGVNTLGELGTNLSGPVAFAARSGFGTAVNRVTTEGEFTCVDQNNGTVQCAGDNTFGTLGVITSGTSTSTSTPQTVGWNVFSPGWQTLHGVTTGTNHACALDQSNYAWCWGDNNAGQLGYSTGSNTLYASPGAVTGGYTFRALAAGAIHTCGIGTNNHIYCWGANNFSQLGASNTFGPVTSPVQALDP